MAELHFPPEVHKELETLQLRFEAKKQEGAEAQSDKEVFKEVFRERYEELKQSAGVAASSTANRADDAPDDDSSRESNIQRLIEAAFHSPRQAVGEAQKLGSYYLDELHDRLADEYYEKLLQFQKLKDI